MSRTEDRRISFYGHDEAEAFIKDHNLDKSLRHALAEELRRAFYRGMYHLYVFQPIVTMPWGEMNITITTRAKSFYDAQSQVIEELTQWEISQRSMRRNDHPWLEEAKEQVKNSHGATYVDSHEPTKVDIFWFDDREK
jgi:hypothetical protein